MYPKVAEYHGYLVAIWIRGFNISTQNSTGLYFSTYSARGDVMISYFDGIAWSAPSELTTNPDIDSCSYPSLRVHENLLWAVWDRNWTLPYGEKDGEVILRRMEFRPVQVYLDSAADMLYEYNATIYSTDTLINLNPKGINDYLNRTPGAKDAFGNEMVSLPVRIITSGSVSISLSSLKIRYNYTVNISNLSSILNRLLGSAPPSRSHNYENIGFSFSTKSPGAIHVLRINISYVYNMAPVFLGAEPIYLEEDIPSYSCVDMEDWFTDDFSDGMLTFTLQNVSTPHFKVSVNGSKLDFVSVTPNWNGEFYIIVRAFDRAGLSNVSGAVKVEVKPVNDWPVYPQEPGKIFANTTIYDGERWYAVLDEYFYDVEYDLKLTFLCNNPNITIDEKERIAYYNADISAGYGEQRDIIFTAVDFENSSMSVSSNPFNIAVIPMEPTTGTGTGCLLFLFLTAIILALVYFIYRKYSLRDDLDGSNSLSSDSSTAIKGNSENKGRSMGSMGSMGESQKLDMKKQAGDKGSEVEVTSNDLTSIDKK
ncbi:MAG: hypothetical protein QW728_06575 [Thermoplasmata archaeon]